MYRAFKLLPLDKQLLFDKCVIEKKKKKKRKKVHGKASQYPRDHVFRFEPLHVHGKNNQTNKKLLPRTRIGTF